MSSPSSTPEYPPLLPIGRHQMSMADLRQLCVSEFPLSTTRDRIMSGFEEVVRKLDSVGIVGEVWVNGSFLTKKIDPNDIDASLRLQVDVWDN
jgi:hypothetical protein